MKKQITSDGYVVDKIKVDMSCFTGVDDYSDGSIENEILDAVHSGGGRTLLKKDNRWAVLYHLSPERANLLSWMDFSQNQTVLEIGCGCGALTGVLSEKAFKVDSVEISPRRAEIAAYRNHDCDNVTIHVGNVNDMMFPEKFDYVTLIGVLEYAGKFTHTLKPYEDFLKNVKNFLKPNGKLIIAIENRMGIKYISGSPEDHSGEVFDSLLDYPHYNGVRTFSHKELSTLLNSVGLTSQQWYYPYPDYKMPSDIFSDECEPNRNNLYSTANNSYSGDRIELFSEKEALLGATKAGLFKELSNSFLVICSADTFEKIPVEYVHVSFDRNISYRMMTLRKKCNGRRFFCKKALNKEGKKHLKTIFENCQILSNLYGKNRVAQADLIDNGNMLLMEYIEGETYTDVLINILQKNGINDFLNAIRFYYNELLHGDLNGAVQPIVEMENIHRKYDIDANINNIIKSGDNFVYIDYEWLQPHVSKEMVLINSMGMLCRNYKGLLEKYGISLEWLCEKMQINDDMLACFFEYQENMSTMVSDNYTNNYTGKRIQIDVNSRLGKCFIKLYNYIKTKKDNLKVKMDKRKYGLVEYLKE